MSTKKERYYQITAEDPSVDVSPRFILEHVSVYCHKPLRTQKTHLWTGPMQQCLDRIILSEEIRRLVG